MQAKQLTKRAIPTAVGVASLALAITGFILSTRATAGGIKNAVNPVYWVNRSVGKDLFDAEERIWYKGVAERNEVALTFDDGPHPESANKLLDILKEKGVKASFFVVGKNVDKHPEVVKRMLEEGHEVGNHTYDHLRLDKMTKEEVANQVDRCEASIVKATGGRGAILMRPPGMRYNETVLSVLKARDNVMVHWAIGAKDFIGSVPDYELTPELRKFSKPTPDQITERVVKQLKPGAIILLHDNPVTVESMPAMIDQIRAKGYEIRLCKDMMSYLPQQIRLIPNPPVATTQK